MWVICGRGFRGIDGVEVGIRSSWVRRSYKDRYRVINNDGKDVGLSKKIAVLMNPKFVENIYSLLKLLIYIIQNYNKL